jgi:hypothetical protein
MRIADKYLWNRSPVAARKHFLAEFLVVLNVYLVEDHISLAR